MSDARRFPHLRFLVVAVLGFAATASAANFPLEIIHPRPNLTTANRAYKAYPGIEYNIRAGVIGGAYPFAYSLTTAPSGMTVNPATGEVVWPNPTTTGSPHSVTLRVQDQEGATATVSWTVTVTTTGFRFVDAVNGSVSTFLGGTGTGTIDNPWRSLRDVYQGNTQGTGGLSAYLNELIYFRGGTYLLDSYIEDATAIYSGRSPWRGDFKPIVWLEYPGESVTFDFQRVPADKSTGHSLLFYVNIDNLYLDGFTFTRMGFYGIQISPGSTGAVLRRLHMNTLGPGENGSNSSFLRFTAGLPAGQQTVIQDCVLDNLDVGAAMKIYSQDKLLIEDCTVSNVRDSEGAGALEGIALKGNTDRATVRHNTVFNVPDHAIGGNQHTMQNAELLYNRVYNASSTAGYFNQDGVISTPTFIYRNTFLGRVLVAGVGATSGPFNFTDNVIVSNDPPGSCVPGSRIICPLASAPTRVVVSGNVEGAPGDGITDAAGYLQGTFRTTYLGLKGWEFANGSVPPPPPPPPDGGVPAADAGTGGSDGGQGASDGGSSDSDGGAGDVDAGSSGVDAGGSGPSDATPGCGCSFGGPLGLLPLWLAAAWLTRRGNLTRCSKRFIS
ncbi:MAG: right-handed parallel beta-helix repeat-containing protein [Myxococcota bacterium]